MFVFGKKSRSKNKDKKVEFPNDHEKAQKNTSQKNIESNDTEKNFISQEKKTSDKENINANSDEKLLALANTIVEVWRLEQAIVQESRFIQDSRSIKRLQNQLTRFVKHYFPAMSQLGLQVIDFTNREYEPGLPVNPINLSDFQADDEHLKIEFMMEPVIKKTNSTDIIHRGVVVLGRTK